MPPRAKLVRPKGAGTVSFDGEMWVAKLPRPSRLVVAREATKERAEAALGARIGSAARGASLDAHEIVLRDWMHQVLEARAAVRLRSVGNDANRSKTHIELDPLGRLPLALIRTADCRGWLMRMLSKVRAVQVTETRKREPKTLSARTVTNALTLLRRALQHAVDMGLLEVNPARDVQVPRAAYASKRTEFEGVLDEREQEKVLAATREIDAFSVMLRVALGMGLRRGELLALRWSDVHLLAEEPYALIRRGARGGPTKGGKGRRLPILGVAREALFAWRLLTMRSRKAMRQLELYGEPLPRPAKVPTFGEGYAEPTGHPPEEIPGLKPEGLALEDDWRELEAAHDGIDTTPSPPPMRVAEAADVFGEELVFPGPHGGRRTKAPVAEFRAALDAAGIRRNVRWHDLRHTCGTSLLMGWWGRQWSVAEVQRMLGHSSASVTERYLHARNELIFKAAREMRNGDARETGANRSGRRLTEQDGSRAENAGAGDKLGQRS